MSNSIVLNTNFKNLKFFKKGKVRDLYDLGEYYLIISTDRLSAFDVIMNEGIPNKGKVLTKISKFWFDKTQSIIPNHVVSVAVNEYPEECLEYQHLIKDRSMLVKKADMIPLECIVRGYISGSGWKEYKSKGTICNIDLPVNLQESEILPEPIFTPSTKAEIGDHDENISESKAINLIGKEAFDFIKQKSLEVYKLAYEYAFIRGIIIADTKMEFGFFNGEIILIDELLTPDSSRFWPRDSYKIGKGQLSFDKQYVRDYLESIKFNKKPPAPNLPLTVINNTADKYKEALYSITGEQFI